MSKYQAMYHSPLGFTLHDFEAESSEAAAVGAGDDKRGAVVA